MKHLCRILFDLHFYWPFFIDPHTVLCSIWNDSAESFPSWTFLAFRLRLFPGPHLGFWSHYSYIIHCSDSLGGWVDPPQILTVPKCSVLKMDPALMSALVELGKGWEHPGDGAFTKGEKSLESSWEYSPAPIKAFLVFSPFPGIGAKFDTKMRSLGFGSFDSCSEVLCVVGLKLQVCKWSAVV